MIEYISGDSFSDTLRDVREGIHEALVMLPVELALSLTFFALLVLGDLGLLNVSPSFAFAVPAAFMLCYTVHLYYGRRDWHYNSSYLVWIPFFIVEQWFGGCASHGGLLTITLVGFFLLSLRGFRQDDYSFMTWSTSIIRNLVSGLIASAFGVMVLLASIYIFQWMFLVDVHQRFYSYTFFFFVSVVSPLVCCSIMNRGVQLEMRPAFVRALLNFAVTPVLLLTSLLSVVAVIGIVLGFPSPDGIVAKIIMPMLAVGVYATMDVKSMPQPVMPWFYNRYHLFSIPMIVILVHIVGHEVWEHGLTEVRVYMVLVCILAVVTFILLRLTDMVYRYWTVLLVWTISLSITGFTPYFNAEAIAIRSQTARMKQLAVELCVVRPSTGEVDLSRIARARRVGDMDYIHKYQELLDARNYVQSSGLPAENRVLVDLPSLTAAAVQEAAMRQKYIFCNIVPPDVLPLGEYSTARRDLTLGHNLIEIYNAYGDVVADYDILARVSADTSLLSRPEELCIYRNDSILVLVRHLRMLKDKVSGDVSVDNDDAEAPDVAVFSRSAPSVSNPE